MTEPVEGMRSDRELLAALARHTRKHEVLERVYGYEDDDYHEADRVQALLEWFEESVDVLNVPPRS